MNGNTATAKGDNTFEGKAAVTAGNKAFARISGKVVEAGSGDLDAAKYTGGKPHFSRPDDMKVNLFKPSTWKLGFRRFNP